MKKVLVIMLTLALALMVAGTALAAGWYRDAGWTTASPHGSYATSTNLCKVCHAVHGATGSTYKLLQGASSAKTACAYCHGDSGLVTAHNQVNMTGPYGHVTVTTAVPDSTDSTLVSTLDCASCHSVHKANVSLNGDSPVHILKRNPDSRGYSVSYSTSDDRAWCGACHDKNNVTSVNTTSHILSTNLTQSVSGVEVKVASANSSTCKACHKSSNGASLVYPHESSAPDLLTDAYNGTALDRVCLDCHEWNGGTAGVEHTY